MRRSVRSVAPSGSLAAVGAGRGLGDDPALRTWGPLLSQVPAPNRLLTLSLLLPYSVLEVLGPSSTSRRGGDAEAAAICGGWRWTGGARRGGGRQRAQCPDAPASA